MSTDIEKEAATEYPQERFQPPDGATELLLIRHGQTQPARPDAPFPLVDGHGDPDLTPLGHEQAARLADRLAVEHIDAIVVTTLCRTVQTASPLAARLGLTPQVEAGLREVYLGEWEGGLFRKMVADKHPIAMRMRTEQRWELIPGAESGTAFATRVREAIERLAVAHPGRRLAVFTHGGVIGQALALATDARPFSFLGADNGSISHLVVADPQWIVRRFNDTAHLA